MIILSLKIALNQNHYLNQITWNVKIIFYDLHGYVEILRYWGSYFISKLENEKPWLHKIWDAVILSHCIDIFTIRVILISLSYSILACISQRRKRGRDTLVINCCLVSSSRICLVLIIIQHLQGRIKHTKYCDF